MNRTLTFTACLISVCLIGYLLIIGKTLIIPLFIAVFIWHLLNTINEAVRRIPMVEEKLPEWLTMLAAILILAFLVRMLIDIIGNNVNEVIAAAPRYQENLTRIANVVDTRFHIFKALASVEDFFKGTSLQGIVVAVYSVFTLITGSAVLISLYVGFLFVEQHFFRQKLHVLFPQKEHRLLVDNILGHIVRDTQTYLGIKTLLSLIVSVLSWIIMKLVGLDFAEFWALLIFFLNFIPNIGAIVATAFPALLALIQFQSWWPFIIITSALVLIEFVVGNLAEPRFLGKSLNVSPLVILFALALWGAMWGILGMFLSVPITVTMMIVLAHFEKTRPLAIILSQDGQINKSYETL